MNFEIKLAFSGKVIVGWKAGWMGVKLPMTKLGFSPQPSWRKSLRNLSKSVFFCDSDLVNLIFILYMFDLIKRKWLNVGTVPTFNKYNVETLVIL